MCRKHKQQLKSHELIAEEVLLICYRRNTKYVLFLIAADVLSEDAIMSWYKEGHGQKGKSVFLEQMKKFIEWLQNAEEESESGEEEN